LKRKNGKNLNSKTTKMPCSGEKMIDRVREYATLFDSEMVLNTDLMAINKGLKLVVFATNLHH
jgi:hypothetical protein